MVCRLCTQQPAKTCPAATQCCEGLPETGIADEATWARLLGPSLTPKPSRDLTADMMLNVPGLSALAGKAAAPEGATSISNGSAATQQQQEEPAAKPYAELFTAALSETVRREPGGGVEDMQRLTVTDTVAGGVLHRIHERVPAATLKVHCGGAGGRRPGWHVEYSACQGHVQGCLCGFLTSTGSTSPSPGPCSGGQGGKRAPGGQRHGEGVGVLRRCTGPRAAGRAGAVAPGLLPASLRRRCPLQASVGAKQLVYCFGAPNLRPLARPCAPPA